MPSSLDRIGRSLSACHGARARFSVAGKCRGWG
jgi:hypothetical protein